MYSEYERRKFEDLAYELLTQYEKEWVDTSMLLSERLPNRGNTTCLSLIEESSEKQRFISHTSVQKHVACLWYGSGIIGDCDW